MKLKKAGYRAYITQKINNAHRATATAINCVTGNMGDKTTQKQTIA